MRLRTLLTDEGAVSPVIGVILMVAITVILAAVIGTFVLGLTDGVTNPPQASFTFEYHAATENLTVTHDGGDELDPAAVTVTNGTARAAWNEFPAANVSQVTAGDAIETNASTGASGTATIAVTAVDTVRVTWQSQSGEKSTTLARWSGPDT